jgi:hypothetical protein
MEQSRFEAFRRATFSRDAVSKYVAHCLIEEQHRPVSEGTPTPPPLFHHNGNIAPAPKKLKRDPILSEVVAPGQAEEITIIVSTLAKAYAQRLVTAARRHASIRTAEASTSNTRTTASTQSNNNDGANIFSNSTTTSNINAAAISPEDLLKAYDERKAKGLDPGFFLQPWGQSQNVLVDEEKYHQKRLAALHAQEEYDKLHGGPPPSDDDEQEEKGYLHYCSDDDQIDDVDEKKHLNESEKQRQQTQAKENQQPEETIPMDASVTESDTIPMDTSVTEGLSRIDVATTEE